VSAPPGSSEGSTPEPRFAWWARMRGRQKAVAVIWLMFPIGLTGFGIWGLHNTLVAMPARYDALEQRGVATTATFEGCFGSRSCDVSMTFRGVPRRWRYPVNSGQFGDLPQGARIAMIVDPRDPETAYTAEDVERRTNDGFGLLLVVAAAFGLLGLVAFPVWYSIARSSASSADMS